jgi:hypothetical protein
MFLFQDWLPRETGDLILVLLLPAYLAVSKPSICPSTDVILTSFMILIQKSHKQDGPDGDGIALQG